MKRCPSCKRTFPNDAPDFCPNDGMRLVKEDAAAFDPERTVMGAGASSSPPAEQPQPFPTTQQPAAQPPPALPQQSEQPQPQQQWQPQGISQGQQQAGWPPAPQQPAPQAWGSSPYQQQPAGGPYGAPFMPPIAGRSRAIAIAALVFGVDAATIMAITVARDRDFLRIMLYSLPILAIALGMTSLFLALKKPSRFGGVELAIAGLALGVAGLVYVLMRGV